MALELKRDGKTKATRLQNHVLDLINNSGGFGVVVHPENWEKVFTVVQTISEGGRYDRSKLE